MARVTTIGLAACALGAYFFRPRSNGHLAPPTYSPAVPATAAPQAAAPRAAAPSASASPPVAASWRPPTLLQHFPARCEEALDAKRVLITVQHPRDSKGLRLALQARERGRFVWLHEAEDIKRLLACVRASPQGGIELQAGPLREVFTHGGTLFIDYGKFTQPEAESLNELFARVATYGGVPVSPELRIIGTVLHKSVEEARWSPAFLNRFHRFLPAPLSLRAADPTDLIRTANEAELQQAHVIDLHSAQPWQQVLTSHVNLDAHGALQWMDAPLTALLNRHDTVVLRNPPLSDPHFLDFMRTQVSQHGAKLAYFKGYTAAEQAARDARHRLVPQLTDGSAHVVTTFNFPELFERIDCRDGRVVTGPGLLANLPADAVLHVATRLTDMQWDALRNHPHPLTLSIAPTAHPPKALAERLGPPAPKPAPTPVDLRHWVPPEGQCTLLQTRDADAAVHALCENAPQAMLINADGGLQVDELQRAMHQEAGVFSFEKRPMAQHLERGGLVILRDLERHSGLQNALASLLLSHCKEGAVVIVQSAPAGPLLEQMAQQRLDCTDLWPLADRTAGALARPGLDGDTVTALRNFACTVDECCPTVHGFTCEPNARGFAFFAKLAAYHRARGGTGTVHSWGHSLADLMRHESGADAARTAEIAARAVIAFGPAPYQDEVDPVQRQAACVRILHQHRGLFLQGPPGSGKSFQAQAIAQAMGVTMERLYTLNVGPATTRADLLGRNLVRDNTFLFEDGPVAAWARDNSPGIKLLVVDEANLPRPGFWQLLSNAFSAQPTLLINGRAVPLSADHKIIFTGNDDHVVGRFVHDEIRDHFIPQHFAAYSSVFLRDHIALPTLRRLAPDLSLAQATALADQALDLHRAIGALPGIPALSPRNIEEALVRVLAHPQMLPMHALNVAYTGMLAPQARPGLQAWQAISRGVPTPDTLASPAHSKANGIVWTHSTCELARTVDAFVETRAWRLAGGHGGVGQVGLLVEGPSGRGKDEVVAQRLQEHGIEHQVLNAGMDYATFAGAIQQAREAGTVVVLSEMNLLPAGVLEGRLNDVLSGPGAHPGFAVVATINPPTFSGRQLMSDALLNRFVIYKLDDYDAQEVRDLVHDRMHLLRSGDEIARLADTHNGLVQDLQNARSPYTPSARELMRGAERLAADPMLSVEQVIADIYALHRTLAMPGPSQAPSRRTMPALTTLANLLEPGGKVDASTQLRRLWRVVAATDVGPRGYREDAVITVDATASMAQQQAQLVWQLLTTENGFATPYGVGRVEALNRQLQAAALRNPSLAAEFARMRARLPRPTPRPTPTTHTHLVARLSNNLSAARALWAAQLRDGFIRAAWFHGRTLARSTGFEEAAQVSGRGFRGGDLNNISLHSGFFGAATPCSAKWASHVGAPRAMLGTSALDTFAPDGTMVATIEAPMPPPAGSTQRPVGRIELIDPDTVFHNAKSVVHLLVPTGQQPINVTLEQSFVHSHVPLTLRAHRSVSGPWFAEIPPALEDQCFRVAYDLIGCDPEDPTPWYQAAERPLPFEIDYAAWPELQDLIDGMNLSNPAAALADLEHFLGTHTTYSRSSEVRDAYLRGAQHHPLVNQFLTIRAGVCMESAHAFAAIARDLFGADLALRLMVGHVASPAGISAGHAWVDAYIPGRGWTSWDATARNIDEATVRNLSPDDVWPGHVAEVVDLENLAPLQDVMPRHSLRAVKRSAVAAEVAPNFRRALVANLEALLFNAALDVRENFAQTPGRLDVERLVRGEVEPFVAQTVGRGREPKTLFMASTHRALLKNGDSVAHETLRALFELGVSVRVFDGAGRVTPARTLSEAVELSEPPPQNKALAKRYTRILEHRGQQLEGRPGNVVSLNGEDKLFGKARRLWLDLAKVAKSMPPAPSRRWPSVDSDACCLSIGNEYQGVPKKLADVRDALNTYAYVSMLEFDFGSRHISEYDEVELPMMPNLRHLRLTDELQCDIIIPYHTGPLHIHFPFRRRGNHTVTVYATDPTLVTTSPPQADIVRVLSVSESPRPRSETAEVIVEEPLDFLNARPMVN